MNTLKTTLLLSLVTVVLVMGGGALGGQSGTGRPMHEATPASAHMFIVNPLSGGGIASLFSTHPPMMERVRRLEAMTSATHN